MFLGQGVHVDAAEGVRAPVDGLGQQPHDLGLADPGGPNEQADAERPLRIADVGLDHLEQRFYLVEHPVLAEDAPSQQRHDRRRLEEEARGQRRLALWGQLAAVMLQQVVDEWHAPSPHGQLQPS
ncbi:hypothetical protein Q3H58_000403 [Pseudomonas psychrotolerans]|nr:hypothetical protein [Pseudomonas psychrotolerans]